MRGAGAALSVLALAVVTLIAVTAITGNAAQAEQARAAQAASLASAWQMTLPLLCLGAMMPLTLVGAAAAGAGALAVWLKGRGWQLATFAKRRTAVPPPPAGAPALSPTQPAPVLARPPVYPPALTDLQPKGWGWEDDQGEVTP